MHPNRPPDHRDWLIPFDSEAFERGIGKRGYPQLHSRSRRPGARATLDEALKAPNPREQPAPRH